MVSQAVGMNCDDLAALWNGYVYRVVLDDKQLAILKAHAAWRLESGNHPPGATMPDFLKIIDDRPLKNVDPSRVTYSGS